MLGSDGAIMDSPSELGRKSAGPIKTYSKRRGLDPPKRDRLSAASLDLGETSKITDQRPNKRQKVDLSTHQERSHLIKDSPLSQTKEEQSRYLIASGKGLNPRANVELPLSVRELKQSSGPQATDKGRKHSIRHYFKLLPTPSRTAHSTSPSPSPSPWDTKGYKSDLVVSSTPPSSPPFIQESPFSQREKEVKRPKRRLTTKSGLPNITMSFDSCSSSGSDTSRIFLFDEELDCPKSKVGPKIFDRKDMHGSFEAHSIENFRSAIDAASESDRQSSSLYTNEVRHTLAELSPTSKPFGQAVIAPKQKYTQTKIISEKTTLSQCKECGMVYNSADDSDVINHHKYHFKQRKLSPKASNALLEDWTSYSGKKHCIFRVTVESSVQDKEFALRALEASYEELPGLILGDAELFSYTYDQASNSKIPRYNIYFQTIDGKFVGIVLAEAIRRGGELYRGPVKFDMQGKYHSNVPTTETQEWVSFDHSFETPVCIDRVWVHRAHQRQGIATRLIDVVCQTFADRPLAKHQVAISLPTEIGAKFATNYFRGAAWMVSDEEGNKYKLPFIVNVRDAKFLIVHGRLEENKGIWRPLKHQISES